MDNKAESIFLGAFGFGVFKNPAQLVAEEFKAVIRNGQYCKKFKNIVFAIKKKSEKDFGNNYRTFDNVVHNYALVINCPTLILPEVALPTGKKIEEAAVGFCHLPANKSIEDVKDLVLDDEGFLATKMGDNNTNTESFDKQWTMWEAFSDFVNFWISFMKESRKKEISCVNGRKCLLGQGA